MSKKETSSRIFIALYWCGALRTVIQQLLILSQACDDVLKSVEISLTNFQNDLGVVSAEIETLQNRSIALNDKLENRRKVEKLLGPAVEEISISPAIVRKLSEGPIDQEWTEALRILDKRSKAIEGRLKEPGLTVAVSDVKPLLDDLTNLVSSGPSTPCLKSCC